MQDTNQCFVTIAAFVDPARAEALLIIMLVCVLSLAVLLTKWRSGIAVHPSSPVALCALLQLSGAGALMENLSALSYDGEGRLDEKIGKV